MSNKDLVLEIVQKMPDDVTLDQIIEQLQLEAALDKGLDDLEAGRVVTFEELKKRSEKWITK